MLAMSFTWYGQGRRELDWGIVIIRCVQAIMGWPNYKSIFRLTSSPPLSMTSKRIKGWLTQHHRLGYSRTPDKTQNLQDKEE